MSLFCERNSNAGPFDGHGHYLPGDQRHWPRDRVVDFQHLRLQVAVEPEKRFVSGTAMHRAVALNDGPFDLVLDAVELDISAVTLNGQEIRWSYDGERLTVPLGKETKRGDELELCVSYSCRPRIGLYFIHPDDGYPDKPVQVWSQGQDEDNRHWFPCYDHPNDKLTSELIVTVPESWHALSNGSLVANEPDGHGGRTFHWSQDRPHSTYLITLAAGEFTRIDASRPDLTIDYYVEPRDQESGELTFADTPEMIALFEEKTGMPYPWAKYSQIVVQDFVFGGMENTSATTMTHDILFDRKAARDHSSDPLISHELAHMWFGDLLTCRDWGHGWLNESFATYLECLWEEKKRGIDAYRQMVLENIDLYTGERYRRPIVSNVWHDPVDIFDRHLYEKGSVVLHMLRCMLGDDAFFRSIRRYVSDNQERSVITNDLMRAFEEETGRNLEWFFDQWVFKPGHPEFKVSWQWDAATSSAIVSVKQTQKTDNGTPIFRAPLTIDFRSGRGRRREFRVEVTQAEHTFVFALPEKPDVCRFDPYSQVLKTVDFDKSIGELRLQLQDDDDIGGRMFAAKSLGKKGGLEAVEALEQAVMQDRYWAVQDAAARALGDIGGESARDALIRCLKVRHPKARRGVVAGLGKFRHDQLVFDALLPFANSDPSYFVESEANASLGKLRIPAAFEVLVRNMERPSFREVVRTGCVEGLVELRDERAFDVLVKAVEYGTPAAARRAIPGAIARWAQSFPDRRRPAGEAIEELLRDKDFRVRVAAANALRTLGDASFANALDDMEKRELDGRAKRAARLAAKELREGKSTPDELKSLREQFEQLKTENASLRDRLAKLEAARK